MVDRNFRLTSVEESQAPDGHAGGAGPWYRYVIENDLTTIYGYGHGSRRHVTQRAKDYIEQLNATIKEHGDTIEQMKKLLVELTAE